MDAGFDAIGVGRKRAGGGLDAKTVLTALVYQFPAGWVPGCASTPTPV